MATTGAPEHEGGAIEAAPDPRGSGRGGRGGSCCVARGEARLGADANAPAGDERKVFCGNLSWTLTEEELSAHMSSVGNVVACSIGYYPDGRSKVRPRRRCRSAVAAPAGPFPD